MDAYINVIIRSQILIEIKLNELFSFLGRDFTNINYKANLCSHDKKYKGQLLHYIAAEI